MEVKIREAEGVSPQPFLYWDSVWDQTQFFAEWTIGPRSDTLNPGGLQAAHALHTAILLSLFTWRRADQSELQYLDGSDRKGWWGDGVDIDKFETELGSKLWLLFRRELTEDVRLKAEDYAREALQPLINQGAVAAFDVIAEIDKPAGQLSLVVSAFSQDGTKIYDQRFDRIWAQERR